MILLGVIDIWNVSKDSRPRTMEQLESQLPSVGVTLDTEILDRVDELVAPGVTLNADDNSYGAAELTPRARRR